jgi:hypothetical protein
VRGLQETLKTIAVLVALWGVVALVAYFGGAIPTGSSAPPEPLAVDTDAGMPSDAGTTGEDAFAVAEDAPIEVEEATLALHRQTLCAAPLNAVWAHAALAEEGPSVFAVACVDGVRVLGRLDDDFVLFASFATPAGSTVNDVAMGDVDGDAASDLVIAMSEGLYFIPRRTDGSFDEARVLAPSRHGALALAALDTNPGLEIAAIHGDGARPEVWVFHGGLSPLRASAFAAPLSPTSIATTDLDADGHIDLVVTGATQTTLAFGDSRGGMPRTRSLATGGARASQAREGAVIIERDGDVACLLQPSSTMSEAGDCTAQESIADTLRDLSVEGASTHAWNQPALVTSLDGSSWTESIRLGTQAFGVHRYLVNSADEVILLGSSMDSAGVRQLELAVVHPSDVRVLSDGEVAPVRLAPLVTHATLPDPNTPR